MQIASPGVLTTYTRDSMGRILTEVNQATLDATGGSGLGVSALDVVVSNNSYTYDSVGRLLTTTLDGLITTNTYTSGMLTKVDYPDGTSVTLGGHNALGQPTTATSPSGEPRTFTYSQLGQLLSDAGDQETVSYLYSLHNLLTSATSSAGASLTYAYDASRRLTTVTNELGDTVNNTLDANSMTTQVQVKTGANTTYQVNKVFDALGKMTQYTGP